MLAPLALGWLAGLASTVDPDWDTMVGLWPAAAYQYSGGAAGSHPLGPEAATGLSKVAALLAGLGPDPVRTTALLTALLCCACLAGLGLGALRLGLRTDSALAASTTLALGLMFCPPGLVGALLTLILVCSLTWRDGPLSWRLIGLVSAIGLAGSLWEPIAVWPPLALGLGLVWERWSPPPAIAAAVWTGAVVLAVGGVDAQVTRLDELGLPRRMLLEPPSGRRWIDHQGLELGFTPEDRRLADSLRRQTGDCLILTPGQPVEPFLTAALLSTFSGRSLSGWHADLARPELLPLAEAVRRTGRADLLVGSGIDTLELRQEELPHLEAPLLQDPKLPDRPAPGELLWMPGSFRVQREGRFWGRVVAGETPVPLSVPRTPGRYQAADYSFEVTSSPPKLELGLSRQSCRPGEVVKAVARLGNHGAHRLATAGFRGLLLSTSEEELLQPLPDLVLPPGEAAEVELWIPAPDRPGVHRLRPSLLSAWGEHVRLKGRVELEVESP